MTGTRLARAWAALARLAAGVLRWLLEPIGKRPARDRDPWPSNPAPPGSLGLPFGSAPASLSSGAPGAASRNRPTVHRRQLPSPPRGAPTPAPSRPARDGAGLPDFSDLTTLHEPFDRPDTKGDPR